MKTKEFKLTSRPSLCEKCKNNNWEYLNSLFGGERQPEIVWCDEKNRPEDERWFACDNFESL